MDKVEVDNSHLKTRYLTIYLMWNKELKQYAVYNTTPDFHIGYIVYHRSIGSWILHPGVSILLDESHLHDIALFLHNVEAKTRRIV